jgi:uncharacterized glyoxalase superfamily protein PhnB
VVRLGDHGERPFSEAVNTPILHNAFNSLVGKGRWLPRASISIAWREISMSEIVLKSIVPILFVRDVSASVAFFQQKLGFEIDFLHGAPPFYGSVSRGEICLHLRFVHQPNFAELAAREVSLILATVEVSDVQGLFEEFKERGVEFAQMPTKQPWGGMDFHVRDPDGNVISFVTYG